MSSDGAHDGVTAGRALDTILGGEPAPTDDEGMTAEQMRAYLEQPDQTPTDEGDSGAWYSEASRRVGRSVLAYLTEHPEHRDLRADDEWVFPPNATDPSEGHVTAKGLYTLAEEAGHPMPEGLTGFMVGWGTNAAKYALGVPPSSNPALIEIGEPNDS